MVNIVRYSHILMICLVVPALCGGLLVVCGCDGTAEPAKPWELDNANDVHEIERDDIPAFSVRRYVIQEWELNDGTWSNVSSKRLAELSQILGESTVRQYVVMGDVRYVRAYL
ncbi:MAG: hypothetical protein ACP5HU_03360, partial [Phycisphaerae bacterium]